MSNPLLDQVGGPKDEASELGDRLSKKHGAQVRLYTTRQGHIHLDDLVVPKESRNQGVGSKVMQDLTGYADKQNKRVTLNLGNKGYQGSTSTNRLADFYKRHGFVRNKGRNADYSISASMYREPE